jgi:O-antigen ligase
MDRGLNQLDPEPKWVIRLIMLFWILRIFKPEWIVAHYIPSLGVLKSVPTVFFLIFLIYLLISSRRLWLDKGMFLYSAVIVASTIFSVNIGRSFGIMRNTLETLLIYSFISTFVTSQRSKRKLFILYVIAFCIFGVWGVVGGGKVKAFMPLDDEDSFGPFMAVGVAMTYFVMSAEKGIFKKFCLLSLFVALGGAVASFARGTFLSLVFLLVYIVMQSKEKLKVILKCCIAGILLFLTAAVGVPDFVQSYSKEIKTIWEEGATEGTGKDRMYLWTRGLSMFADNPILGVGPGCYGFKIASYITQETADAWGVRFQMYGRAIHNIYLEMLSETGLLGLSMFTILLYSFRKRNVCIRSAEELKFNKSLNIKQVAVGRLFRQYALGLEGGMIVFLANGFFFNLLYYSWFWDLIILNTLLYHSVSRAKAS